MILPTKHIPTERALLGVGANILRVLDEPATTGGLWDEFRGRRAEDPTVPVLDYRWFVLALDLLYTIGVVELERGLIRRTKS